MKAGNRVLVRLARRSIVKAPLRSLLIVALIAIVVAVGTGTAIAIRSALPSVEDKVLTQFGSADTLFVAGPGTLDYVPTHADEPVLYDGTYIDPQSPAYDAVVQDLIAAQQQGMAWAQELNTNQAAQAIEEALGADVLVNRQATLGATGGPYQRRAGFDVVTDIDMAHPLADGFFKLVDGRFPQAANEIAIAAADNNFAEFAVGDRVTLGRVTLDVVGLITKPSTRYGRGAVVTPAAFDMLTTRDDTLQVQVRGVFGADVAPALAVVQQELDWESPQIYTNDDTFGASTAQTDPAIRVVPALVSSVLGIQLALVAAAAFAVGVRRRTKEFGQLITTGMDGNQLRRMILFEAILLGVIGAIVGVVIGVVAVSQFVSWGWLREVGERYVDAPRWNVIDWLAPASIGVLAAIGAAWWPARSLTKAPATAALAGHLPAGRAKATTPRWGLLVVIVGSLVVAGLAASTSADQSSLMFAAVFLAAVAATFLGTLLFIGSILTAINQRSGRFPLLARLVVRSSDRHRSRSWMVIGAFIATLALPVLLGASFKAYPDTAQLSSEFDRRLLTVRSEGPSIEVPASVPADVDLQAEVDQFVIDLDRIIADELEPAGSIETQHSQWLSLSVTRENSNQHFSRGYGAGVSVITPELIELFDIPDGLARQVEGDTVLYIGTEQLVDGAFDLSQNSFDGQDWVQVPIEVIDGPDISSYEHNTLVSPELAAKLNVDTFQASTLHVFAEPLSVFDEQVLYERANELWIDRFGAYAMPSGSSLVTPAAEVQDWVLRQTSFNLQQSYQSGPTQAQLRWGSLALSGLLAALIAVITASLAAVELDGELQSMIATGAAPRTRRLMLGAQTLYHLVLAALLGIPLALLLFYAVARADDWGPTGVTIPWGSVAMSAVIIPLVVAAIVTVVFRNGRPAVSRRLS